MVTENNIMSRTPNQQQHLRQRPAAGKRPSRKHPRNQKHRKLHEHRGNERLQRKMVRKMVRKMELQKARRVRPLNVGSVEG